MSNAARREDTKWISRIVSGQLERFRLARWVQSLRTCRGMRRFAVIAVLSLWAFCPLHGQPTSVTRGADELFWVPTLEQALEMASSTGRPLFLMGYSLVGNGSTYTKIDSDYCTGVF